MDRLDAYLDELVSQLDCDPLRRDEIRLEVHVHLRELVEDGLKHGQTEEQAVSAAIERFGAAADVAARLSAVHRGRSAPVVRRDRPLIPIVLAALVIVPLSSFMHTTAAPMMGRSMDAMTAGPDHLQGGNLTMALRNTVGVAALVHPGPALAVVTLLALALAARHFTPRRAWLWAGVAYVVGSATMPMLGLAFTIAGRPSQGASLWTAYDGSAWIRSAIGGLAWPMVAVWAVPWIAPRLGRLDLRLPWPLLALALLVLTAWSHPLVLGLANLAWRLEGNPQTSLSLGLASWPWQLTRLAAMLVAMWVAGQGEIQAAKGRPSGQAAVWAAAAALAAGLLVTAGRLVPAILGPDWRMPPADVLMMCGEFLVLFAAGSAVLTLVRLSVTREPDSLQLRQWEPAAAE